MNLPGSSGFDIIAYLGLNKTGFEQGLTGADAAAKKTAKQIDKALNVAIFAGAAAFTAATLAASKFEKQMADVNTLLDGPIGQFQQMNKDVLELAGTVPVTMQSLTKGLYDLVSAGAPAATAVKTLGLAAKAATAGVTSVDVAVRAGMATINAYGLEISDLNTIYDLQFSAVKKGVMTYEQLAGAIGNVLPSAASLGVSLNDLYGALAHVTKAGIDAQSASTYLARAFESMVENRDDWEKLGIAIFDASGEFRGLQPIIGDLAKELDGLTTEQKQMKLETLDMEKRAAKAILSMVNNYKGFSQTMKDVADSHGAMEAAFTKEMDTLDAQAGIFKNIVQASFIKEGNNWIGVLTNILEKLNEHPEMIASVVKSVSTLAITFGTLAAAIKVVTLVSAMNPLILGFVAVTTAVVAFNAAMEAREAAQLRAIDAISDEVDKVEKLEIAYDNLAISEDPKAKDEMRLIIEKLAEAYGLTKTEVDALATSEGKLTGIYKERRLKELKDELNALNLAEQRRGQQTQEAIDLGSEQNAQFREALNNTYGYRTEIETLNPKINALAKEIGELEAELKTNNDTTDAAAEAAKALAEKQAQAANTAKQLKEEQEKAAETAKKLAKEHQQLLDSINPLNDANEKLLADYESLIPEIEGNDLATKNLYEKLISLNTEMGNVDQVAKYKNALELLQKETNELKNKQDLLKQATDSLKKPNEDLINQYQKLIDSGSLTASELKVVEEALTKLKGSTKDYSIDLGACAVQLMDSANMMGLFGDAGSKSSKTMDLMTGVLDTVTKGGFDPLSLGITVAIGLIKIFSDEEEVVVRSTEEVITSLGGLGVSIENTSSLVDTLASSFESSIINKMMNALDAYIEALRTAEGARRDYLERMVLETQENMERLLEVFTLKEAYEKGTDSLQFFIDEYNNAWSLFGRDIDVSGLDTLMIEQLESMNLLLYNLDPLSQAYKDLYNKIYEGATMSAGAMEGFLTHLGLAMIGLDESDPNYQRLKDQSLEIAAAMIEAGVQSDILDYYLNTLGLTTQEVSAMFEDTTDAIEGVNDATEEQIQTLGELEIAWSAVISAMMQDMSAFETDIKTATQAIEDMLYFRIDVETSDADEQIAAAIARMEEYVATLDPASQAYADMRAELDLLTAQYNALMGVTEDFAINVDNVDEAIKDFLIPVKELSDSVLPKFKKGFDDALPVDAADKVIKIKDAFDDADKSVNNMTDSIKFLKFQWEDTINSMLGNFDEMEKALKDAQDLIDQISFFSIDLDASGVDEELSAMLIKMANYAATLAPGSPAQQAALAGIDEIIQQMIKLGIPIPIELRKDRALAALLGINSYWDEMKNNIDNEALNPKMDTKRAKDGLDEINQKYENLKSKMENTIYPRIDDASAINKLIGVRDFYNTVKSNLERNMLLTVDNYRARQKVNEINSLVNNIKTNIDIDVNYRERGRPAPIASKEGNYFGKIPQFSDGGVLALLHPPEVVISQETTKKYSAGQWETFNKTGDPSVLGANSGSGAIAPEVHIHAEYINPESTFTIWDQNYNPRKKYVERYLESSGHPFA